MRNPPGERAPSAAPATTVPRGGLLGQLLARNAERRGDALLAQRQSSGAGWLLQQSAGLVAPAVALAGAAELWKLDPTLAATLGIAREEPAKADGMWGGCGGCGGCG